jgi:membrane-bound lytic murein transglycosylase MltF
MGPGTTPRFWKCVLVCTAALLASCGGCEDSSRGPGAEEAAGDDVVELRIPDRYRAPFTGDLDEIRERGVLRVLMTPSRTDFFIYEGRPRGLQVELTEQFEAFLNEGAKPGERIDVVYLPVNFDRLLPALLEGRGDLVAGFLTLTDQRERRVAFLTGRGLEVDELVVTGKDAPRIETLDDLAGRTVHVMSGSSYVSHLTTLSRDLQARSLPAIEVETADPHLVTEDLLELANAGLVDFTVADDFRARLWSELLTDIEVREDLVVHHAGNVGWAARPDNPMLIEAGTRFVSRVRSGTLLGNMLFKRYYASTRWIENPTTSGEMQKLLRYAPLFRKYGEQYGFPWLALAAQAYQESGLEHSRRSPVGAVGLMQLLPSTAADPRVGFDDITDLESNVHAGAKYMALLRDTYFADESLAEDERMAFVWAAYNAGPNAVRRMRSRAAEMGLDPDRWFGNVEYAAQAMKGREPVRYVSNIFKYYLAYKRIMAIREARDRARH